MPWAGGHPEAILANFSGSRPWCHSLLKRLLSCPLKSLSSFRPHLPPLAQSSYNRPAGFVQVPEIRAPFPMRGLCLHPSTEQKSLSPPSLTACGSHQYQQPSLHRCVNMMLSRLTPCTVKNFYLAGCKVRRAGWNM